MASLLKKKTSNSQIYMLKC